MSGKRANTKHKSTPKTSPRRRKLGQHFLADQNYITRIIEATNVGQEDNVLEIGPGAGVLTNALIETGAVVTCIEIDEQLYDKLMADHAERDINSVTVYRANALKFDFTSIPAPYHVVSNLPYSVATPIIEKLIGEGENIITMTLMTQKEVGERLTAAPGDPHFGSLSIFVGYYCQTEFLFTVPPEAFTPPPAVDSAVIQLTPRSLPPVTVDDPDAFFLFVRTHFLHRRKTLRNNFNKAYGDDCDVDELFRQASVDDILRPGATSIEQFAALYNTWRLMTG
jgi:16S rRNA (adenine1518-N6/adenine1519-N6)-dimethyltransferase